MTATEPARPPSGTDTGTRTGGGAGPGQGPPPAPTPNPPSLLRAPEERGRLDVHASVVATVAEEAADRTPGTVRVPRRALGADLPGAGTRGASARVHRVGDEVDLALDLALDYPAPIRATCARVRDAVRTEVERATGYRVRAVRITVSALQPKTRPRVR